MALQVFLGGDLITDTGVLADGMLIAKEGVIDYAGPRIAPPDNAEVIDSAGACIAPGFVDLHIHGGAGSDFMDATAHDVETVFRFHAAHGTTAMCPSTATASKADILACLEQLAAYDGRFGRNLGAHVEGPYLSMSKRGCHLPEFVRDPEESEWRDIVERGPIASMTLAPELPGARALVEELHRRGIVASAGHSEAA